MELTLEQVEKVSRYTGVTFEQAKAALERTGGSPLDAVILLEKEGKAAPTQGAMWSTRWGAPRPEAESQPEVRSKKLAIPVGRRQRAGSGHRVKVVTGKQVADAVKSLLRNCTTITIDVWRGDDLLVGIPLIISVLLFLVAPYVMIPLTIGGLMLRCRYHISGWNFGEEQINRTMDQVSSTVSGWTDQVLSEMQDLRDKHKK